MMNNVAEQIRVAIYRTIDSVNDLLPPQQAVSRDEHVVLVGQDAALDSMGFVNFIVALEEELEHELHRDFNIPDLLAMRSEDGGSLTVADLIAVLSQHLG